MARPLKIAWKHPAEGFYQLYKQEVDAWIAKRWQALWMLRRRERLKRVKEVGGQPQADSAGAQGVVWDHAAFHKGKAVGEVLRQLEAEEKVSPLVRWRYIRQALNDLPS
jgi:hypothetical protein